jgi:hypothetical protein
VEKDWRPHCPYLASEADHSVVRRWLFAKGREDAAGGDDHWVAVETEQLLARYGYIPEIAPWWSLLVTPPPGMDALHDTADDSEHASSNNDEGDSESIRQDGNSIFRGCSTAVEAIDVLNRFTDLLACRRSEALKLLR